MRPWTVSAQDGGPKFTFADEPHARQRARELVEESHSEAVVYSTDPLPDLDAIADPEGERFADIYAKYTPYDERWLFRHGVDPVRQVFVSGVWRAVELEPRYSDPDVRADGDHRVVPDGVWFEWWANALRGTCLSCHNQCYRRAEDPRTQVWRHGFPTD